MECFYNHSINKALLKNFHNNYNYVIKYLEEIVKYRLYVDEVGNPGLQSAEDPRHRYLSLTGIILELDYVDKIVFSSLEGLKKKYFHSHVDDPIIFHRKEMVNTRYPFKQLRSEVIRNAFDNDLIRLLKKLDYIVITIVLDKLEYRIRYKKWQADPYHYSLRVLLERYVLFLTNNNFVGDVMAESRGGKEDMRLKASYKKVYKEGTEYVGAEEFQKYLTSGELKVKQKSNNIAGLQLADLLAHPSYKATLARRNRRKLASNFGGEIAQILEKTKYYRSPTDKIEGWGRKWLP